MELSGSGLDVGAFVVFVLHFNYDCDDDEDDEEKEGDGDDGYFAWCEVEWHFLGAFGKGLTLFWYVGRTLVRLVVQGKRLKRC